ncbi:hypothetical protein RSSM_01199 [Rhodopirellula sallentina SM41]|uniref:Uncharacterized protein n=1 Tax=Rhodopirellula sallentina SM41 TaxID=1263870 RepID=M5UMX0_9BACT|nr:hypothetical protein RSSM_01199 [Rhodopirellula sallentina SM41]
MEPTDVRHPTTGNATNRHAERIGRVTRRRSGNTAVYPEGQPRSDCGSGSRKSASVYTTHQNKLAEGGRRWAGAPRQTTEVGN